MKILFVNYHHLDSNSGIQIFNLANELTKLGLECVVCVPGDKAKVFELGEPLFQTFTLGEIRKSEIMNSIDLIHVWTPREITRKITQQLLAICICPYIVHLEDNEEFLMETLAKLPSYALKHLPELLLKLLIRQHMSHPTRFVEFLSNASGITVITESLKKFCPPNIPHKTIWAGYQEDLQWNRPIDVQLKHQLGLTDSEFLIAYTGNVHRANLKEVTALYEAIEIINNEGINVKLIRTGSNYIPFTKNLMGGRDNNLYVELGRMPRKNLPSVLSIADVLVQPGTPNRFNDYRFPSKIPEYLASGKPVILPKTNIGLHLKNKEECILLEDGSANDIAQKMKLLLTNELLGRQIGSGGRKFAEQHLKWSIIAKQLLPFFYGLVMEKHHRYQ